MLTLVNLIKVEIYLSTKLYSCMALFSESEAGSGIHVLYVYTMVVGSGTGSVFQFKLSTFLYSTLYSD